jgi:hypothetical protein
MPKAKRKTESAVDVSSNRLLGLLADIRAAVGDPTGKLMQDELVEHCRKLTHTADWNSRRLDMLLRMQKHMRDPERTLVCDIIANCQLLPDPDGKRYGFATTGTEHYRPNEKLRDAAQ